jgi:hypothetical protein
MIWRVRRHGGHSFHRQSGRRDWGNLHNPIRITHFA